MSNAISTHTKAMQCSEVRGKRAFNWSLKNTNKTNLDLAILRKPIQPPVLLIFLTLLRSGDPECCFKRRLNAQITFLHQKLTISHQIARTKTTTSSHQILLHFPTNFTTFSHQIFCLTNFVFAPKSNDFAPNLIRFCTKKCILHLSNPCGELSCPKGSPVFT